MCCSCDNRLIAWTCAPVFDRNLERVLIGPFSTAQEKVPFSLTSAQKEKKKKRPPRGTLRDGSKKFSQNCTRNRAAIET